MSAAKRDPRPPELPGLRFLGRPFTEMPEFFRATSREHGPIVRFRSPFRSYYLIDDAALIEELFVTRGVDFKKGRGAERLVRLLGRGLLTATQPEHLVHRRMIQPAFHRRGIEGWARTMVDAAAARAAAWREGATVDLALEMNRLALEIVAKALFGTDLSRDMGEIARALDDILASFPFALAPFSELFDGLPLPANRRFAAAKARLDAVVYRMMRERREAPGERGDLLSTLLEARDEAGNPFTDQQIRDEAMTMVLAGHETTANAMAWAFYLMGRHPEVEAAFGEELERVLGGRAPSLEDVARLPYVEAVFSEAMRLYPPAWITARRALVPTQLGAYRIARGDIVIASQYVTHRNAAYFERPDRFEPERFVNRTYPKFAFFPFGGGNRLCIGERFAWTEGVLVLATLGQSIRFEGLGERDVAPLPLVTLRPSEALLARAVPRNLLPAGGR